MKINDKYLLRLEYEQNRMRQETIAKAATVNPELASGLSG